MDLDTLLGYQWSLMTPEFIIVIAAVVLSLLDLFSKKSSARLIGYGAFAAVIAALVSLITLYDNEAGDILEGSFVLDGYAKAFKTLILFGSALVLLLAVNNHKQNPIRDTGEYFYLFLTALLGGMFMTSSHDLIMLFVGLELLTLSSYILVGIRRDHKAANEAAMKYVINGGIATAITLFGLSYLYGLTGTTNILEMNGILQQAAGTNGADLLMALAFLLTFVGLSFKLGAAPFHMWAPDVYQGAATPVTAFLGTVSKVAGFALVVRLFLFIFASVPAGGTGLVLTNIQQYIAVLAAITMIVGNIVALKQSNVKRMFAYSGVAHAGYLLVPFVALSDFTFDSMFFYLLAYILMNVGVFAVIHALSKDNDDESLGIFAGLFRRSPLAAVLMTVFILSLAGIPGTAGFIGKVNIFLGAFALSHYVLPSIMMATSVISFVYYFRILQQMFFRHAAEETKVAIPLNLRAVLLVCAVLTVLLGILPSLGYNLFYDQFAVMKQFFFTGAE